MNRKGANTRAAIAQAGRSQIPSPMNSRYCARQIDQASEMKQPACVLPHDLRLIVSRKADERLLHPGDALRPRRVRMGIVGAEQDAFGAPALDHLANERVF